MSKKKIAVVFGGNSNEYEVSLQSAANVIRAIDEDKWELIKIGISRRGQWFVTQATSDEIERDTWIYGRNRKCILPHDPTVGGIYVFNDDARIEVKTIDCFFPVLHGAHGEDGEIQGLFSMAMIPFVGSGLKASANCMDKSTTKQIAGMVPGVKMADHFVIRAKYFNRNPDLAVEQVIDHFDGRLPLFVKPCSAGSSVGVTKINKYSELPHAIRVALEHDSKLLIEEAIIGREFEVAMLGNTTANPSAVGEILSAGEFYDYESKYTNPESMTRVVDDIPEEDIEEIRRQAVDIFRALDCRGLGRVDFFYTADREIYFNELNTLPGFTNISMYPMLWNEAGVSTTELVDKLIEYAFRTRESWTLIERSPVVL